jgi:cytoskeleton protein RodZ
MFSVGATLKRARQAQSLDLDAVAARTRINVKYLEAIEADDRGQLPSGFFYKSFVDQYARCLSLDTRELQAEVDRVLSADAPLPLPGYESVVSRNISPLRTKRRFPASRSIGSVAVLLVVVGGCSGVYTIWRHRKPTQRQAAHVGQVEVRSPRPAPNRVAAVAVFHAPQAASEGAQEPSTESVRPAGYKVRLDVLAHEATWLSVSTDGKPAFSGILQENQSKRVGGQQFAKMRVGNAAGIEVRLNGKLLAPLGARGQVLDVLFTPTSFHIVSAAKESD